MARRDTRWATRPKVTNPVLLGYEAAASDLIARYDAISSEDWLAPVVTHIPKPPSRILDIGAGTGRDAAWLAAKGHAVTAVEPVAAFREAGCKLHPDDNIAWLDDQLPALPKTLASGKCFDMILIAGVWQHLKAYERAQALKPLSKLASPEGRLILSLRHGPGASNRPVYPGRVEDTLNRAQAEGFELRDRATVGSLQAGNRAAGMSWTWLVFSRPSAKIPT